MPRMARISFIMPLISAAAFSFTCARALAIICCMRAMSTGSPAAWRGAAGRGAAGRWAGAAGRCGVANWVCNWGRGWAISEAAGGDASEAASSLASARISTTPSPWRFDRITASGPSASRTLRSASRDEAPVNFFTFMTGLPGRVWRNMG